MKQNRKFLYGFILITSLYSYSMEHGAPESASARLQITEFRPAQGPAEQQAEAFRTQKIKEQTTALAERKGQIDGMISDIGSKVPLTHLRLDPTAINSSGTKGVTIEKGKLQKIADWISSLFGNGDKANATQAFKTSLTGYTDPNHPLNDPNQNMFTTNPALHDYFMKCDSQEKEDIINEVIQDMIKSYQAEGGIQDKSIRDQNYQTLKKRLANLRQQLKDSHLLNPDQKIEFFKHPDASVTLLKCKITSTNHPNADAENFRAHHWRPAILDTPPVKQSQAPIQASAAATTPDAKPLSAGDFTPLPPQTKQPQIVEKSALRKFGDSLLNVVGAGVVSDANNALSKSLTGFDSSQHPINQPLLPAQSLFKDTAAFKACDSEQQKDVLNKAIQPIIDIAKHDYAIAQKTGNTTLQKQILDAFNTRITNIKTELTNAQVHTFTTTKGDPSDPFNKQFVLTSEISQPAVVAAIPMKSAPVTDTVVASPVQTSPTATQPDKTSASAPTPQRPADPAASDLAHQLNRNLTTQDPLASEFKPLARSQAETAPTPSQTATSSDTEAVNHQDQQNVTEWMTAKGITDATNLMTALTKIPGHDTQAKLNNLDKILLNLPVSQNNKSLQLRMLSVMAPDVIQKYMSPTESSTVPQQDEMSQSTSAPSQHEIATADLTQQLQQSTENSQSSLNTAQPEETGLGSSTPLTELDSNPQTPNTPAVTQFTPAPAKKTMFDVDEDETNNEESAPVDNSPVGQISNAPTETAATDDDQQVNDFAKSNGITAESLVNALNKTQGSSTQEKLKTIKQTMEDHKTNFSFGSPTNQDAINDLF